MAARLKERYQKEIAPAIAKEFGIENPMAIPRLEKIVINMGLGEAIGNAKIVDTGADELRAVTGQKPVTTRAKKSIASFKLRQGMPIGTMVTLRGDRMYEFFDRLVSIALPRVRDFRGVSPKAFDGRGNYTRCERCGGPRGYLRKFKLCRICFRELALQGQIPGVVKSSW